MKSFILRSIAVNSTAELASDSAIGSQTECALLRFCVKMNTDYRQIRGLHKIWKMYPFDRNRKRMSTVVLTDTGFRVFTKGACEGVLDKCISFMNESGQIVLLHQSRRSILDGLIENECSQSFRTLALAYQDYQKEIHSLAEVESDLTLICILSICDSI
jgi:magnesium-transporting ATPase (P-type)